MSESDEPIDLPDAGGGDLFGDEDNDAPSDQGQALSDKDLASDQDVNEDYDQEEPQVEGHEVEKLVWGITLFRHRTPKTKDGTLQAMRVPNFLKIDPEEYKPESYEPSEWHSQNMRSDNPKGVVRWKRDPETGEAKSNTVMHRWSDGSVSLSVGGESYEINKKQMAPPRDKPYQELQDSHYYVAAAHIASDLLMTVGHVDEMYTVVPSRNQQDDALAIFTQKMQAAARGKRAKDGDMIILSTKDPELQKKEAELAEKERMKAQRRRENAAARLEGRPGGYRSGGLSVGDLEGRRAPGGMRKRGQPGGAARAKKHRPEYDSDDDLPPGRRGQDEYDREDDFIAPSDDESGGGEGAADEDEEDDLLDDDDDGGGAPRSSKRQKTAEAEDEDADADADLDDEVVPASAAEASRARRRNIIDEDDEE